MRFAVRSAALTGDADILYNIGQVADRLRQDEVALDAYERYLEARPDAPDRVNVEGRIRRLQQAMASEQGGPDGSTPSQGRDGDERERLVGRLWTWTAAGAAVTAPPSWVTCHVCVWPGGGLLRCLARVFLDFTCSGV